MSATEEIEVSEREVRMARIEMAALQGAGMRVDPLVRRLATAPIVPEIAGPTPFSEAAEALKIRATAAVIASQINQIQPAAWVDSVRATVENMSASLDPAMHASLSKLSSFLTDHELTEQDMASLQELLSSTESIRGDLYDWVAMRERDSSER